MSILGKIKAKIRTYKHISRKAQEHATDELWLKSYSRLITPSRLEVSDTHLLIDQRTYVRCLIAGLPKKNGEGYPRDMTSKAIERIQELSFEGCKIMLSHSLIQIAGDEARDNLQRASFNINMEQKHKEITNNGSPDLELLCKGEDVNANYRQIYFNSQRSFHSSFLIVIMGREKEVFTAESYIISILKSELIEVQIPFGRQLEMFLSALPFPVSDSKSWVEVRSDTAAVLCTSTNLNSRTDEKGMHFGKDLKTNNEILIDLDTLPAKHLTFLGATGAGKTFSFLVLLMRMHDMCHSRIVYTTPKADVSTDYKAVAEYYGVKACIADIGAEGANINPLQILLDTQSMGTSPYAYAKAYDRHKDLLNKFFSVWFGSEFSSNMESYLDETLNVVYKQAGIYRDRPETWSNAFPVFRNLRDIWAIDAADKDLGTKQKTAEALFNKTYHLSAEGSLSYMNKPTTELDLSKDFIIIDLSNVPELIQDAMNVLVTGMIASRFSTDNDKETIIAVDEAAVFLRNPELSSSLLKTLTQGRSHKVFLWLATHQPSDFAKNKVKEEYKTNMFINIVLGANLKNAIEDVKDYFDLTQDECDLLVGADVGEGLLIIKDERIPIRFEPSELEMKVIKGKFKQDKIASPDGGIMVFSEYQNLVDDHRIIFSDWMQGDTSILIQQGYEKHKVQRVGETGSMIAFCPAGMVQDGLINLPHLGDQTLDHYASVVQLAGLLEKYGAEEIALYHNQQVDISCKINGLKVGFEYENYNNKNLDIIIKKKESALENHDVVMFITSSTDLQMITRAVGAKYCIKRGSAVTDFIESLTGTAKYQNSEVVLSGIEPIAAL